MNLPNFISLARLLSVPLIVWMIVNGWMVTALWASLAAGLSDAVDGFLAKRFSWRTKLGVYLDPIADKVLLVSLFLALGVQGHLPSWLVILVVFRDLMIVGGALLTHTFNLGTASITPLMVGKLNTLLQIMLVLEVLARVAYGFTDPGVGSVLIYAVAATTLASGAGYVARWVRATRQVERPAE